MITLLFMSMISLLLAKGNGVKVEKKFHIKNLRNPKYFLGIEISHSSQVISLRFVLGILDEVGISECRSIDSPMSTNIKLHKY